MLDDLDRVTLPIGELDSLSRTPARHAVEVLSNTCCVSRLPQNRCKAEVVKETKPRYLTIHLSSCLRQWVSFAYYCTALDCPGKSRYREALACKDSWLCKDFLCSCCANLSLRRCVGSRRRPCLKGNETGLLQLLHCVAT